MKARVRRTSHHYADPESPPCQGAYRESFASWDRRTFRSEAEADRKNGAGWWRSVGTNHRPSLAGGIERQMDDEEGWAIEIKSLDDLERFIERHGEIVLSPPESGGGAPTIEIYDSCRE